MTIEALYQLPKETLMVMRDALDASMRSPEWRDNDMVNGMSAIDWAEHVCVACDCA